MPAYRRYKYVQVFRELSTWLITAIYVQGQQPKPNLTKKTQPTDLRTSEDHGKHMFFTQRHKEEMNV